jgi:hypothetical protein
MSDNRASGSPMMNAAKHAIKTDHWSGNMMLSRTGFIHG